MQRVFHKTKKPVNILFIILVLLSLILLTSLVKSEDMSSQVLRLEQQLQSTNVSVRITAVKALYAINDERAILPLTEALKDKEALVRKEACKALAYYKNYKAVEPINEMLNKEKDFFVIREAIRALGTIKSNKALFTLKTFLRHENIFIRKEAENALRQLGVDEVDIKNWQ